MTFVAWAAAAALVGGAWGARAQTISPEPEPESDPYIVKQGDILETLAARFLGSEELWPEIWRINPGIKDPHRISPGQRILIPRPRTIAEIRQISRRVDSRPQPVLPWSAAHVGEQLKRRAGVRTHRRSSTQLRFEDGSDLTIGEESLVFLREPTARRAAVSRSSIEIVEGQGDLALPVPGAASARADIEVVVGSARVSPSRAPDGTSWSRARQTAAGGPAQLMIYKGAGEVQAGGSKVKVGEGMGTSVERGEKPKPPEPLLPAPAVVLPSSGAGFDYANPRFAWRSVAGARSYTVEVCADAACARLVARVTEIGETEWVSEGLPVGDFFWRVTAQSATGLDGYPSHPRSLTVRTLWRRPAVASQG